MTTMEMRDRRMDTTTAVTKEQILQTWWKIGQHSLWWQILVGDGTPRTVAALKGKDIVALAKLAAAKIPALARAGLAASTVKEHERMLKKVCSLPADLLEGPADVALLEWVSRTRKARTWRWTSTLKAAACLQGSLRLLPCYRMCPYGLALASSPIWCQGMRAMSKAARAELPRQPKAATWHQVQQAIAMAGSTKAQLAILLGWFTTQRIGCVRQLEKQDIEIHGVSLSVRFRRGKVVAQRGPYTVQTGAIPLHLMEKLRQHLETLPRSSSAIFSGLTGEEVKLQLRKVDRQLEQRSLRRGALQTLSTAPGMTNALLLHFSGHASVASLMRYLNWGMRAQHLRVAAVEGVGAVLVQ